MSKERAMEIREAVQAADRTLEHLERARQCLRSAGNWGLYDMLGGGTIATFFKRGRVKDAQEELARAREAMRRFAAELRDVGQAVDIRIVTDDFVGFADYFFDGLIADWMMQSRIDAARGQVDEAMRRVRRVRDQLRGML